uniref:Putative ovule protein n=1 Tax=Solanum chacoense TaxID=4108 RepID=A0A0V0HNZ6_SOLCH
MSGSFFVATFAYKVPGDAFGSQKKKELEVWNEKKINKMRRSFIWQGNKEQRGYNLVKLEILTLNINQPWIEKPKQPE